MAPTLRRIGAALIALALLCGVAYAQSGATLVYSASITAAGTATGNQFMLGSLPWESTSYLAVEAKLVYVASAATSAKAYVQTSLDGGTTWIDIMCFAFTTSTASKVQAVVKTAALAANYTPTDGALADNTILSGLLGDRLRVKVITVGTYGAGTTLQVWMVAR